MVRYEVRALDGTTWQDFADLVERHNGVWGGCWCMGFHPEGVGRGHTPEGNREAKERRVRTGGAHAALVYDDGACLGWCQFGPTDELLVIKNARTYREGLTTPPDWRITCFFVDRKHRRQGVASTALAGALDEIARSGGGTVEAYPENLEGRELAGTFIHTGTVALFEQHGFERTRQIGKHRWVVTRTVGARRTTSPSRPRSTRPS